MYLREPAHHTRSSDRRLFTWDLTRGSNTRPATDRHAPMLRCHAEEARMYLREPAHHTRSSDNPAFFTESFAFGSHRTRTKAMTRPVVMTARVVHRRLPRVPTLARRAS